MDEIRIIPTTDEHVEGLNRCLDTVAGVGRHKPGGGGCRGPGGGLVRCAAPAAGDVPPRGHAGDRDAAAGARAGARPPADDGGDRGRAWARERIQLGLFASNTRAIALYESLGFVHEGIKRRARKFEGRYDDDVLIALFPDEPPDHADW